MLADEDMGFKAGDGQRHHQLLGMPKGKDHLFLLGEEPGHMFPAFGLPGHCAPQHLNDLIADRRHHRHF